MLLEIDVSHVRGEAVSTSRHQFDIRLAVWLIAERLSQCVHVLCQVGILDERLGPQRLHQLRLAHHPVMVLRKEQQEIEGFWRESDCTAGALNPA